MWLKGVVMRAHFNGLIPRNPFAQFHISPNVKEREYLTEDELKALMTHEFGDAKLSYIRDIFVFASFTALSFVDIKELTNDNIVEVNGEKWILSKRHKTKVPFQVKLLDIPLQIIERYRPLQEDNLVFPNLNYWSICKPLKKVMKECGITKDISFHCARHGFATLALSMGMPIESVSRVLGHTNIHDPNLRQNHNAEIGQRPYDARQQTEPIVQQRINGRTMKRNIIEITEHGTITIPSEIVWMSEEELVSLFGVIAPSVRAAIKTVYKNEILKEYEVQRYIRISDKISMDVYSLEMVVALAFHIRSYGAERVRNAVIERLYLRKEKTSIYFSLCNSIKSSEYQA